MVLKGFKMRSTKWITLLAGVLCVFGSVDVDGQENPLRETRLQANYGTPQRIESEQIYSASPIQFGSDEQTRAPNSPWGKPTAQPPSINDTQVVQATFNKVPIQNEIQRSEQAPSLNAALSDNWTSPKQILDLITKLSLNLIFVLSFAVGVILLAKKWVKKDANHETERVKSDSLNVIQTLRVDQKISLRLVQWRTNRFLIACDQNGIQSVNALNASFDQTLAELDKEEQSDEELLKKLISSLEVSRT